MRKELFDLNKAAAWNAGLDLLIASFNKTIDDCVRSEYLDVASHFSNAAREAQARKKELPKNCTVFINSKGHRVLSTITYQDLIDLAGMQGTPSIMYSHEGIGKIFTPKTEIEASDGMSFTVVHTNNA